MMFGLDNNGQSTTPLEIWIRVAQDKAQWLAYVSKVTDTQVPWHKMWNKNWPRKPET